MTSWDYDCDAIHSVCDRAVLMTSLDLLSHWTYTSYSLLRFFDFFTNILSFA